MFIVYYVDVLFLLFGDLYYIHVFYFLFLYVYFDIICFSLSFILRLMYIDASIDFSDRDRKPHPGWAWDG